MPVTNVTHDLDSRTLTIHAEFSAPIDRVWDIYADPRKLEKIWGPPQYPATVVDHELRPGGRVNYYMTLPKDSLEGAIRLIAAALREPKFLREELGKGFIDKSLAVFYAGNNLSQCSLKKMAPPFDEQLKLTASVCVQLRAARQVGDEIVDCPKAMGASGGGAKRDILKADVKPPPVKDCTWPAMEAILDRGDKTFVCQQSTGKCASSDATSQRAQLKIRWQEHEVVTAYDFDYFEQLKQHAQSDGNNGLMFRIPKNKTSIKAKGCEGYLVRFEQAPVGAGGGPIPKAADNRWKNVDLPQLLH